MTTTNWGSGLVDELAGLLEGVRLGLQSQGDEFVVPYENERHAVRSLPLADLDPRARRAELLAVAAGFDAAIKSPAQRKPGETFLQGAPGILPKVERARFVDAYHAIVAGRGGGDAQRLVSQPLGAGLVTCYVHDEDWRMTYVTQEQRQGWEVSPGTIDSAARSHLYARAELHDDATIITTGDYYDAARVTILGDRFFHRGDRDGIVCGLPGRDVLFIGPEAATGDAVAKAYDESAYPLSPYVLRYAGGTVRRLSE